MVDKSISAELVDATPEEAGFYPDQLDLIRQRGHEASVLRAETIQHRLISIRSITARRLPKYLPPLP